MSVCPGVTTFGYSNVLFFFSTYLHVGINMWVVGLRPTVRAAGQDKEKGGIFH